MRSTSFNSSFSYNPCFIWPGIANKFHSNAFVSDTIKLIEITVGKYLLRIIFFNKMLKQFRDSADEKQLGILKDTRYFEEEYYVHIRKGIGKGGRERYSPIIGEHQKQIADRIIKTPEEKRCGSIYTELPTYTVTEPSMQLRCIKLMQGILKIFRMIKLTREQEENIKVMFTPAERTS